MAASPAVAVAYRDRVRGCLLGGAVGDALGAGIEFASLTEIRSRYGRDGVRGLTPAYGVAAPLTDDTQLTLFTAEGLIRAHVRWMEKGICHLPTVVWHAYRRWLATQEHNRPPEAPDGWLASQQVLYARRAPGNACLSGLRQDKPGTPEHPANPGSKGCGAVMRSAPFGLVRSGLTDGWQMAAECAVLTHGHPSGYLAAATFACTIGEIVDGRGIADAARAALARLATQEQGGEVRAAVETALDAAAADTGAPTAERVESLGAGWIAEEALAIALYCAAAAADDPRRALLAAVNHSGDSDSTGAICGNLIGTALGDLALPWEWAAELEGRDLIAQVSDDLVREYALTATVRGPDGFVTSDWFDRYPGC